MKKQTLPLYPFPNFMEGDEMQGHEFNYNLPLEVFLKYENIEVKDPQNRRIYTLRIKEPTDQLVLEITSYKGISAGARHTYGNILLPRISFVDLAKSNNQRTVSTLYIKGHHVLQKIELDRLLTKRDYEEDKKRYEGYNQDYVRYTKGFKNCKEVEQKARKFLQTHLPGFNMIIKDHT